MDTLNEIKQHLFVCSMWGSSDRKIEKNDIITIKLDLIVNELISYINDDLCQRVAIKANTIYFPVIVSSQNNIECEIV